MMVLSKLLASGSWGMEKVESLLPFSISNATHYSWSATLCSIVGASAVWYLWRLYDDRGLPPGPTGLPILGCRLKIQRDGMEQCFDELHKRYGEIASIQDGKILVITLNSQSAIKELFVHRGDECALRPEELMIEERGLQDDMFTNPYRTEGWHSNRSLLTSSFRSAGYGPTGIVQDKVHEQIQILVSHLQESVKERKPVDFMDVIPKATINVIFQVLMNKAFEYDDPELGNILDILMGWIDSFWIESMYRRPIPWWLPGFQYKTNTASITDRTTALRNIIRREVEAHMVNCDSEDIEEARDFVGTYLKNRKTLNHSLERIVDNILIFIPDATDSMSYVFSWIFLYLAEYQDVQEKMVKEIGDVGKGKKFITWADRAALPFTEAVIMEVIRVAPFFPMTAAHSVQKETIFRGYRIPTRATIYGNLREVHRDPTIYPNPEQFKPERFIDHDGTLMKSDNWIPFSMGRRKCPGEQVAKMELILFTSNLLHRYHMTFPEGSHPSLEPTGIFCRMPAPYKVILSERK